MSIYIDTAKYQEAVIDYLKSDARLNVFANREEIREEAWAGKNFTYPLLRVAMGEVVPVGTNDCSHYFINFRTIVYSEKDSSKELQVDTSIVNKVLIDYRLSLANYFLGLPIKLLSSRARIPFDNEGKRSWGSETLWRQYVIVTQTS